MKNGDILVLKSQDVLSLLTGREKLIMDAVRMAYEAHASGNTVLPHSLFLRFPDKPSDRIIALPAYLGEPFEICGLKWVASFPNNIQLGLERASAVIILNSTQTGRPVAILEGSSISTRRTAASAALAARSLHQGREITCMGLIGCGLINFEIARFVVATYPEINSFLVFDTDIARARQFKQKCGNTFDQVDVEISSDIRRVIKTCRLIAMATTAISPHIADLSECSPGSTILHISLRDLAPEVILACDNVVDDIDHVCRAQTSVHLAEQLVGNRDFIRCTLADILLRKEPARKGDRRITVFSPFGLGILDLAVSKLIYDLGMQEGKGMLLSSFLPSSWVQDQSHGSARR